MPMPGRTANKSIKSANGALGSFCASHMPMGAAMIPAIAINPLPDNALFLADAQLTRR